MLSSSSPLLTSNWLKAEARLPHVLEHIVAECDLSTLAAVARTSSGGLAATTPHLYRSILVSDPATLLRVFYLPINLLARPQSKSVLLQRPNPLLHLTHLTLSIPADHLEEIFGIYFPAISGSPPPMARLKRDHLARTGGSSSVTHPHPLEHLSVILPARDVVEIYYGFYSLLIFPNFNPVHLELGIEQDGRPGHVRLGQNPLETSFLQNWTSLRSIEMRAITIAKCSPHQQGSRGRDTPFFAFWPHRGVDHPLELVFDFAWAETGYSEACDARRFEHMVLEAGLETDMGGSLGKGSVIVRVRAGEEEKLARREFEALEMDEEIRDRVRFEIV